MVKFVLFLMVYIVNDYIAVHFNIFLSRALSEIIMKLLWEFLKYKIEPEITLKYNDITFL